jgi:hypothetical protein
LVVAKNQRTVAVMADIKKLSCSGKDYIIARRAKLLYRICTNSDLKPTQRKRHEHSKYHRCTRTVLRCIWRVCRYTGCHHPCDAYGGKNRRRANEGRHDRAENALP